MHTVGPVAAYARCRELRRNGMLSDEDFRSIGRRIVERSREINRALANENPSTRERILQRECQIIEFISALFSLESG
jgi:hypothetical protein